MTKRLADRTALALAIIALGFGLRIYRLDAQSFWYDEAYSSAVARATPTEIISNRFTDVHPPLYYLVLHFWQTLGDEDFTVRLLSAMLGTAAIAGVYSLGKRLFGSDVGLLAAAMTSLAPYTVFYGQEARMYSLLLLLSVMLVLSYHRMLHTASRRWWLAYTTCALLAMYTQYSSALLVLGLHLHFLITRRRHRGLWAPLLTSDALVLLAVSPQVVVFLGQAERVAGPQWSAPATPDLARLISAPYALTLSQFSSERLVPLGFALVLLLLIVTHLQLVRHVVKNGDEDGGPSLLLCALWSPLLAAFILSQWRSIYRERALIVVVPALYLLLAWGVVRTRERYFNLAIVLLVGCLAMAGLNNWYIEPTFAKPPFRTAGRFLSDHVSHDQPIIHTGDAALLLFMRYAPQHSHYLIAGDPAPHMPLETYRLLGGKILERESLTAPRFWLVFAPEHSLAFQQELVNWFDRRHQLAEVHEFDGIVVRRYESDEP